MTAKKALVCIVNARMSNRSTKKWSYFSSILRKILSNCCFIGASSQTDFYHYKKFYDDVHLTGNLKYDAEPLLANPIDLEALKKSVGKRKVFVCASTHPGEEEILLKVYKKLRKTLPDLLMIIVPRHFERGEEIYNICFRNQLLSILRSTQNTINNHIPVDAQIYIVNTLGELGLIFNIGKIVFMGGSLVDIGGHNVCEPARLGCTVITGKHSQNFLDIVKEMEERNGIVKIETQEELVGKVLELFDYPAMAQEIATNGKRYIDSNKNSINKTVELLEEYGIIKN